MHRGKLWELQLHELLFTTARSTARVRCADDVADMYTLAGDDNCAYAPLYRSVPEPAIAAPEKSSSVYLSIISQQTFIGCWKLNTELSSLLSVSLDQLQNSAPVKVSFMYGILWEACKISL